MSNNQVQPGLSSNSQSGVARRPETITMFGVPFHNVGLQEVFDRIDARIESRQPGYVVTPNVDHICRHQHDAAFQKAYADSFLSLADGVPVIWASRLVGAKIREKISGSDLVYWLSEHCAKKGHSLFLFGAADGVAEKAGMVLQELYPGLKIAGTYSPPMGFEKNRETAHAALKRIVDAKPDVCFVALGAPKQELWMQQYGLESGVPVSLGIGAGLDFVAGVTQRAPKLMQRAGLEWFWRLTQDPKRMARRYLVDDSVFFKLVWREWRARSAKPPAN